MVETIMIVDDETGNRELLEAILTEAGYQVVEAATGAEALAQATAAPPDLILLDLMMPGMSGFEVCQRLKQESTTGAVPIIVVTALGQVKTKEQALMSGADDFVTKPVEPEDLRARVAAMLKVRRIHQELDRTLAYLHELEAARHAKRREAVSRVAATGAMPAGEVLPNLPVLLVDDEALTRQFYGDLLAEHGFHVWAASDGAEALALASHTPVEAVLLDLMMPGISGLEVLGRLKAQDPDLPVIVLTAHASAPNAITALKLGAFDFIIKGLAPDLVVLAVHRAVRHRRNTVTTRRETEWLRARITEMQGRQQVP
jgi:two-component system cell cycle response regulator